MPPTATSQYSLIRDPTFYSLMAANLITLYLVLSGQMGLGNVLWVYWTQSVIIGAVNVLRILMLTNYTTDGFEMNNRPVNVGTAAKIATAVFFCFHYGFFHLIYAVFLAIITLQTHSFTGTMGAFWLATGGFAAHHTWSFIRTRGAMQAAGTVSNLGQLMFKPYIRIIPMHLTIIVAFNFLKYGNAISLAALFTGLKLVTDSIAHAIEHKKST